MPTSSDLFARACAQTTGSPTNRFPSPPLATHLRRHVPLGRNRDVPASKKCPPRAEKFPKGAAARRLIAKEAVATQSVSKKKAQPTVRRVLKRHETLATLEDVTPKSRTKSTPDSTGKANFPHDLEHGSLIRRSGHISARRRRALDGDMHHAGSSAQHGAELVD